jgi:sigma-B regulation protein RsbU (phosphoserine phosphatase)
MVAYASRVNRLIPIVLALLLCGCVAKRDITLLPEGQLHTRIPDSPAFTQLVFRAYVGELSVFVDGKRIYTFRDPQSVGRLTLHTTPLPPHSAGKHLDFEVPHPPRQETLIGATYVSTDAMMPFTLDRAAANPVREETTDIAIGFVLCIIGTIALIASLVRRRGDVLVLRAFGAFTLLYGARMVINSPLPYFYGCPLGTMDFIEAFITYVIPVAGWALPLRLIGNGWKSSLRWQVILFAIFAPIGILSDLVTGRPASLEQVNNVLVIAGGVNILFNLLRAGYRKSSELRIVLAGSLLFMLFALNNNLHNLGMLPWEYEDETPGFVLFVAALGFAATRAFVRGERDSIAIENELRTAREIQQSILPRAMPDLPGVRFDAAYVPATSVGGDMYGFLADERGAGVLVADVAGHGVPAALIASMVKIAVSSQARFADDPATLIAELNAILRRDVRRAFVTATYLWLDTQHGRVTVCNAGHPPPLLHRDGEFLELGAAGVLLGRFGDARYSAVATELRPGDRIVAYTDGITEARDAREEAFGEERLRELVRAGASAESVLAAVQAWRTADDADDLTIVIVNWENRLPAG